MFFNSFSQVIRTTNIGFTVVTLKYVNIIKHRRKRTASAETRRSPPSPRLRRVKAEEVGFEPTRAYTAQRFSKPSQWTTMRLLQSDKAEALYQIE